MKHVVAAKTPSICAVSMGQRGIQPAAMHVTTSLYLNLLRLLAALTVLVGHASVKQISGGLFRQAGSHDQDAVAVFFVLSGFVIGYVTHRRESSASVYILHRA